MDNTNAMPSIMQSDLYLNKMEGVSNKIDRSRGRVQKLNGELYYSPNSSKDVDLPPPINPNKTPFVPPTIGNKQNLWNLDFNNYRKPTWWTVHFGWLSFLTPALISSYDILLRPLSFSGIVKCDPEDPESRFAMRPLDKNSWLQLEKLMVYACRELRGHYDFAAASPPSPHQFGFCKPQPYYNAMARCIQICGQWYSVWGALLSYSIACAETRQSQSQTHRVFKRGSWMQFLASNRGNFDFTQWVDQLGASMVASFHGDIDRVGTFVDLEEACGDPSIPHISWFCDYNVPVWYRWTTEHAANPTLAQFGPLPEQFHQLLSSNIPYSPASPQLQPGSPVVFDDDDDEIDFGPSVFVQGNTTEMEAFFKQRTERNKRILQRETSTERQNRQNRERHPPTVSSTVIIWSRTCTGEYKSSKIVGKANRRETLESYSASQKRYDGFHNEWHICHLWAEDNNNQSSKLQDLPSPLVSHENEPRWSPRPLSPLHNHSPTLSPAQSSRLAPLHQPEAPSYHDDDDDDGISLGSEEDFEIQGGRHLEDFLEDDAWSPQMQSQLDPLAESTSADRLTRAAQSAENEILDVLRLYFGYIPLSMLPATTSAADTTARKMFCRALGIPWKYVTAVQNVFECSTVRAAMNFFQRLAANQPLQVDEWDLKQGNHEYLCNRPLFKYLRRVDTTDGKSLYLFDFGSDRSTKWILGLRRATDAAMLIRKAEDFAEYEIAEYLLVNGIPFHTLQTSSSLQQTPRVVRPSLEPLIRPTNHTFTKTDYLSYRQRCRAILEHPRGRAALMNGGYHWRLAMGVVKWEDVLHGPSGLSPNADEMVTVEDEIYGHLIDDRLSRREADALCGSYEVPTGQKDQIAIRSWFMPPDVYEESAIDLGRWSLHSEELFEVVSGALDDPLPTPSTSKIAENLRQPFSKKQWKNRSRTSSTLIKATQRVENETSKLFL